MASHRHAWVYIWHAMTVEMRSLLPGLCEGKPPVTNGFPSQKTSNVGIDC